MARTIFSQLPPTMSFSSRNGHTFLLPLGFDEFHAVDFGESYADAIDRDRTHIYDTLRKKVQETYGLEETEFVWAMESLYRDAQTGAWWWFEGSQAIDR